MKRIGCVGDNCVDHYRQTGEDHFGGNPVNVAVYTRRLGGDASYVGAVGTDSRGAAMLEALRGRGVDVSHVHVDKGSTAVTYVEHINGDRVFGDYSEGVMAQFALTEEDIAFLGSHDLVVSGLWGHAEGYLSRIRQHGAITAFDCSDRPEDPAAQTALPGTDIAFFSDDGSDDEALRQRLTAYWEQGGRLLLTGRSGLWTDREELALEVGARFEGASPLERGYLVPEYEAVNGRTAYVVYAPTYRVTATGGQVAAQLRDPYFNRTYAHFCSHQHAPDQPGTERPGAILTADTAYVAFDAFEDYARNGAYYVRELLHYLIEALIGDRASARAGLPDRGILTLRQQPEQRRTVAHLLFTYTSVRGDGVEVIEDVVPLREVPLTVRLAQSPRRVYLAPSGEELSYVWDGKMATVTVPSVELHQMVVFDQ